jgi:segregation and condensation protein B
VDTTTRQGLEALLFLADEPLELDTLGAALELDPDEVEEALLELAAEYERERRGMVIQRAAGGWRMYTAEGAFEAVERHVLAGRSGRLTQAALETLAVVAYKQPISRQEVSDIRGVNADGAVRSLVARGFVEEVGRDEGPGQAILYGTTTLFLERIGADTIEDLPPLTDFLPEEPAPDEPGLGQLKEARKRLAAGEELPGGARESRLGDRDTNTGVDAGDRDGDGAALPPMAPRVSRRETEAEMDELTGALERVARSAMAQLREAVDAAERTDEEPGGDGQDGTPPSGASASPAPEEDAGA